MDYAKIKFQTLDWNEDRKPKGKLKQYCHKHSRMKAKSEIDQWIEEHSDLLDAIKEDEDEKNQ